MAARILIDASARRFRAQKIYLRAVAAMRWVQARNQILQGQQPHAGHAAALQRVENALAAVSAIHVFLEHILNITFRSSLPSPMTESSTNSARRTGLPVIIWRRTLHLLLCKAGSDRSTEYSMLCGIIPSPSSCWTIFGHSEGIHPGFIFTETFGKM